MLKYDELIDKVIDEIDEALELVEEQTKQIEELMDLLMSQ